MSKSVTASVKTQARVDSRDQSLDRIKAQFFQEKLTWDDLVSVFLKMGYGPQGAKNAADFLKKTGRGYRDDFRNHHPSLYFEPEKGAKK